VRDGSKARKLLAEELLTERLSIVTADLRTPGDTRLHARMSSLHCWCNVN
jgi:hypothetical protein